MKDDCIVHTKIPKPELEMTFKINGYTVKWQYAVGEWIADGNGKISYRSFNEKEITK